MTALEGMFVLDLTMLLPGPFCTLMMADFGAEVIKVEPPIQGDYIRWFPPMIGKMSARHHLVNRNKKSMTLDLKSEKGKEIFIKLLKKADILVEGFRPGVMERLGLNYDRVKEVNPKIIYCSISGYGQDGPYKNLVGHDINYIGMAGLLDISGKKGEDPAVPGVLTADIGGGMMALIGILLACQARVKTGKGQYIDISMLDGLFGWLYHIAGDYFATDKCPTRGDSYVTGYYACYTVYPTKDGKYITVGALEEKFWRNFCQFLKLEELIPYQFIPEKQEELKKTFTDIFLKKTRDEWVETFSQVEVCLGPVKDLKEAFNDPQVVHRQMIETVTVPELGKIKQLGIPIKLSQTPGKIKKPAPELGEDTEGILKDLGYSLNEIDNLHQKKII